MEILTDYVLFDLETTGLYPETDEVIEIAALRVAGGEVVSEFSTLVDPGIHIPYVASRVNGITDDMVKGAPPMDRVLREFVDFVGDSVLMGHNIVRFDMRFIQKDACKYLGCKIGNELADTLMIARSLLPELPSRSLASLAQHYNVSYAGAHRALADCYINKKVYDCMMRDMRR
ncbi:MAG: 3'-5' exonuclease [Clostridiales bacterium]|nr:3'-5' exonuclease [Clostridiales bacterium]